MRFRRILAFTLLEILLVIAIVSLVAGGLGVGIVRLVKKERFRAGVEIVANKLRVAQELMLVYNTDVDVVFTTVDGTVSCYMKVEQPLSPALDVSIKKLVTVKGVSSVIFSKANGAMEEGDFTLRFISGGTVMSKGSLQLFASRQGSYDEDSFKVIELTGQPAPIAIGRHGVNNEIVPSSAEQLYPHEIEVMALPEKEEVKRSSSKGTSGKKTAQEDSQ